MSNQFHAFAVTVHRALQKMLKFQHVFVTDISGDAMYDSYQAAFPEGTNPIFVKRAEHDCSTCRSFIRRVGNLIAVDEDNKVLTVWDMAATNSPAPYNIVAAALREKVLAAPIEGIFRVSLKEYRFGAETTRSLDSTSKQLLTWSHLYSGDIPSTFRCASPGEAVGVHRTTAQVFERGLLELKPDCVSTVLSLIEQNTIYRGEEHLAAVQKFQKAQHDYMVLSPSARPLFVHMRALDPASRFRNTVIGTLVQELSEGKDLEVAVKSFESKVAPANYQRTSSLITPSMVKQAMQTIAELDLEPALERRLATFSDISVRDVLWVDGAVKPLLKPGIESLLMQHAAKPKKGTSPSGNGVDISMDDFLANVLPGATGLEVMFKNSNVGNLMALTAPVHPKPQQLFRWNNDFAWSYSGNVADSYLRQQVQKLGGRVDGVLRFSHMWNHEARNASLMDLHVFMPGSYQHANGCHDTYPGGQRVGWNRRNDHASGGVQDVDYVNPAPEGYVPVENITFPSLSKLKEGQYVFKIHNWSLRPPTLGGFRAEIEFDGQVFVYDHPSPLKNKEWVTLAVVTLKDGKFTIEHKHPVGNSVQTKWGLTTEKYVRVNSVTLSPNYWGDNAVGNKHTFFVLDGCMADEDIRGIYNEFLHPRLVPHRKVLEVLGDKTKCKPTPGHLAGLGFSSTKKDQVVVRVRSSNGLRIYNVQVG